MHPQRVVVEIHSRIVILVPCVVHAVPIVQQTNVPFDFQPKRLATERMPEPTVGVRVSALGIRFVIHASLLRVLPTIGVVIRPVAAVAAVN